MCVYLFVIFSFPTAIGWSAVPEQPLDVTANGFRQGTTRKGIGSPQSRCGTSPGSVHPSGCLSSVHICSPHSPTPSTPLQEVWAVGTASGGGHNSARESVSGWGRVFTREEVESYQHSSRCTCDTTSTICSSNKGCFFLSCTDARNWNLIN